MASIITATTTSGLTQSADNSGVLQLASGAGNLVTVPSVTGTAMVSGAMPAFSAYNAGSNQTISNSTPTKVILPSETFDTNNCFDSTTNYRFTPTVAGYYQFNAQAQWTNTTGTGYANLQFFKNGSEVARSGLAQYLYGMSGSCLVYMNGTTDYIELYALQVTGGNFTLNSVSGNTIFSGSLVRAA